MAAQYLRKKRNAFIPMLFLYSAKVWRKLAKICADYNEEMYDSYDYCKNLRWSSCFMVYLQRKPLQMPKTPKSLNPAQLLLQTGGSREIHVSDDIAILHSLAPLRESSAADLLHTPQYVEHL